MRATRILLAHPHPLLRSGLRHLLEREPGFQIAAEAADSREALLLAEFTSPAVALLDLHLPPSGGLFTARSLHGRLPFRPIVFLSSSTDEEYIAEALKTGARGFVQGDAAATDLVPALRAALRGRYFLSPSISAQLWDSHAQRRDPPDPSISEHLRRLFCLSAAGRDTDEIAKLLSTDTQHVLADRGRLRNCLLALGLPPRIVDLVPVQNPEG
jgi:two-component system response regulator NreC